MAGHLQAATVAEDGLQATAPAPAAGDGRALIVRDLTGAAPLQKSSKRDAARRHQAARSVRPRRLAITVRQALISPASAAADGRRRGQARQAQAERVVGRHLHLSLSGRGETAGNAEGAARSTTYEFFLRLGKRLIAALASFRHRRRPGIPCRHAAAANGDSGPLWSARLDSLENLHHPGPRVGTLRVDQGAGDERRRQPAAAWTGQNAGRKLAALHLP